MPTSFFAPFDVSSRDADGFITPLAGATIKVRVVGGADITTKTADSYGFVGNTVLSVDAGTEIEFYHATFGGIFRQTTAATQEAAFSPILNFIVDDANVAYREATGAEIWLEDLSDANIPRQKLADITPGTGLTIPYQSGKAKNVKLYLLSKDANGQTSDVDFQTAETATVAIPSSGEFSSIGGLASPRLLGRWQANMEGDADAGKVQEIQLDSDFILTNLGLLKWQWRGKTINFAEKITQAGSFSAAIDALANTTNYPDAIYTLEISEPTTVDIANNTTKIIPAKFHVTVTNEGVFNLSGNRKLKIDSMAQVGMRKIFNCSGTSKVVFGFGAVEYFNLAWWAGTVSGATVTQALKDILESCANNEGGRAFIPSGAWFCNAVDITTSGVTFFGATTNVLGNVGSRLVTTSANSYILKVGENLRNINLNDMVLDATGTTSTGLLAEGSYPNSTYGVHTHNVYFRGGAYGYRINSTNASGDPWEFIQANITNCYFIGQTVAARWQNTNNNGITGKNNYYRLLSGKVGIRALYAGTLTEENYLCVGTGSVPSGALQTDGTTFIEFTNVFQIAVLEKGQDENITSLVKKLGGGYGQVGIVINQCLIQSYLDFYAAATVFSRNNIYVNYNQPNYRNGNGWVGGLVSSTPVRALVDSYGDTVDNRVVPTNFNLNGFTNPNGTEYSYIARQNTPGTGKTFYKDYIRFGFATGAGDNGTGLDDPVVWFADQLNNKAYLGIGNTNTLGAFFGFLIRRKSDGKLHFNCNQAPTFGGYVFDDGIVEMQRYMLPITITSILSLGSQTIHKPRGMVWLPAGDTEISVTNNLVNVNSIVLPVKLTLEGNNAKIVGVQCYNGYFTIRLDGVTNQSTKIGFEVLN